MKIKRKGLKNLFFWLGVGIMLMVLLGTLLSPKSSQIPEINFSEFLEKIEHNGITEVIITGNQIKGEYTDGTIFKTVAPPYFPDLINILKEHKVVFKVKDISGGSWLSSLFSFLPLVIIFLFMMVFMNRMAGAGNKALSFGKSKAKLFAGHKEKTTFKDVAGIQEAKEELYEIIEFLKNPQKFQALGGKIPKGVLLVGPPGCGKTLLAKAIAGEAEVPFISISGSDFVEMFVGVGASRVRDLFEQGKKIAPCLIFVDELDAVGRQRGAGLGGGHDEREQTLNQLLVEMDGFDSNEGVILLAATNRPDILDSALLRPGRFDRRIIVNMPDIKGREQILRVHTRKIPLADDVKLEVLARSTPGFSGADLANVVNEAALIAARHSQDKVTMKDMEYAKDKILMGVERKSMIISEEEKKTIAYHEAGHALIAALIPEADPIHKVTIIPRGLALGVTQQLPLDDRYSYSKNYLEAQLSVFMAGRIAEELFLEKMTTGASSDFKQATEIARKMVCEWGMSDLGPLSFGERDDLVFLGKDLAMHKNFSEKTAELIDLEAKKIITKSYNKAKELIEKNRANLEKIAKALLDKEVLNSEEINEILK